MAAGFSWRVNGISNAAVGGRGVPEDKISDPSQISDQFNDSYLQKIVKVIPVEIVGGYLLALQLASGVEQSQRAVVLLIIFVGGFALTYGSMVIGRGLASPKHWDGQVTNRDRAEIGQVILALIAYCLWAYLQGGVFDQGPLREIPVIGKDLWPYSPVLGTLAIIAFAIALNWFRPAKKVDPATK